MNYMKQVAKMLGVELGEKFDIDVGDGFTLDGCCLNGYGLYDDGLRNDSVLNGLLTGECTIKKKRWKPKDGEEYFYVDEDGNIGSFIFDMICISDTAMLYMGNCFRTSEDAEAHKDEIMAKFKEALGE